MKCPSCGSLYSVDEMQFMGHKEGYFLLSMTCTKCNLPVWVNFFSGQPTKDLPIITDLGISDYNLLDREPIAQNEVIDFHSFLRNFDGNFRKYIKK